MLKLNAGFSRKVGEPNYGSRGASVNVELEVESGLIGDPDALMTRIRSLLTLAKRSVDAAKNLPGEHIVIDVAQNKPDRTTGKVFGCPALLYRLDQPQVRWVVMPLHLGLPASRETLGSNFEDDKHADTSPTPTTQSAPQGASPKPTVKVGSKRRTVQHEWPEIGAALEGTYEGQSYTAVVVNAPRLKSGRAIQVTSGPVAGRTFNSMSAAMVAATAEQRRQLGLGTSKKGLPPSGWEFWSSAHRKAAG